MRRKVPGNSATPGMSPFAPRRVEAPQHNPFARPPAAEPFTANLFGSPASAATSPFSPGWSSPAPDATAVPPGNPALPQYSGYTRESLGDRASTFPAFALPTGPEAVQPVTVRVAYVALLVAAAAAAILSAVGVFTLTELRESVDNLLHVDPTGAALFYASEYVDNAELAVIGIATMLGVLFAIAYILVARAIRKGRSWPRPIGTGLAIFSLPAMALGPVATAAVLAGIVAVIASWMPSAREYSASATYRPHA